MNSFGYPGHADVLVISYNLSLISKLTHTFITQIEALKEYHTMVMPLSTPEKETLFYIETWWIS